MKTYVKIALGVVMLLAISGILAALYFYNLKHPDMAKARPDFIITASVLQEQFEDDETAASARYINKIIEVNGIIASVKPAADNVVNITLATDNDLSSVICTFPSITDPSKFNKGDKITIRGECSGYLMDVLLNNCSVVQ